MTLDEVIDGVLHREGGFVNHPSDKGGATNFGITARSWGRYNGWGRDASPSEIRRITPPMAATFYRMGLAGHPFKAFIYEPLRLQMIDFGINSGDERAVRWLQRAMGIKPDTDVLTERLIARANALPGPLVNNALVAARLCMVDDWTDEDASQKAFEEGVESRALLFFVDGLAV